MMKIEHVLKVKVQVAVVIHYRVVIATLKVKHPLVLQVEVVLIE
jgi:hypothetical protein